MSEEKESIIKKCCSENKCRCGKGNKGGVPSCVYGLGFVGALVYYIQQADNFQAGLIGFFKALTWPAWLIYELLKFLSM